MWGRQRFAFLCNSRQQGEKDVKQEKVLLALQKSGLKAMAVISRKLPESCRKNLAEDD